MAYEMLVRKQEMPEDYTFSAISSAGNISKIPPVRINVFQKTSHDTGMMLVKAKTGPSDIHGIGLFAKESISKGTKVWEFTPGFDLVLTKDEVARLSEAAREQFLNYAYTSKESGNYILCSDDARFFNHESNSNITCMVPSGTHIENALECFAVRDISAGEEITNNYTEFDANPHDIL